MKKAVEADSVSNNSFDMVSEKFIKIIIPIHISLGFKCKLFSAILINIFSNLFRDCWVFNK